MFLHPANPCSSSHIRPKGSYFHRAIATTSAKSHVSDSQTAWVSPSEPAILVQVRAAAQSANGPGGGGYRSEGAVIINSL